MRKIAACIVILIFFAGISIDNKTSSQVINKPEEDTTLKIESVNNKVSTIDSLLVEINKEYNGKKKY